MGMAHAAQDIDATPAPPATATDVPLDSALTEDAVVDPSMLAEPVSGEAEAEKSGEVPAGDEAERAEFPVDEAEIDDAAAPGQSEPGSRLAENVDLSQPVDPDTMQSDVDSGEAEALDSLEPNIPLTYSDEQPSLFLLDAEVPAATSARLSWSPDQSFDGIAVPTPVLVVNGAKRGPVLCVTAAVHGDELNGIEVVRRVLYDLEPEKLSGAVIGVPIVNLQGFRRGTRYLPDRRDLNRFFPGNPQGSLASRIAHSFFTEVIDHCEALIDLHTGSFNRTNLPQLRADLKNPDVVRMTRSFGSTVVLHSNGAKGTLRRAATDWGIPSVTLEAGEPARLQTREVEHGTKGVMTLLNQMDMYRKVTFWGSKEPVYYQSEWVRADRGGVLFSDVDLGERVLKGQTLGTITDPITNVKSTLKASSSGRVLGMALNQFVMPGFAAFRIGIETAERQVLDPDDTQESSTHTADNFKRSKRSGGAQLGAETEAGEAESKMQDVADGLEDSE